MIYVSKKLYIKKQVLVHLYEKRNAVNVINLNAFLFANAMINTTVLLKERLNFLINNSSDNQIYSSILKNKLVIVSFHTDNQNAGCSSIKHRPTTCKHTIYVFI